MFLYPGRLLGLLQRDGGRALVLSPWLGQGCPQYEGQSRVSGFLPALITHSEDLYSVLCTQYSVLSTVNCVMYSVLSPHLILSNMNDRTESRLQSVKLLLADVCTQSGEQQQQSEMIKHKIFLTENMTVPTL